MLRESKKNCCQVGNIFKGKRSIEILAEECDESPRQIHRYLQLNNLIPELMELMDEKKIKLAPGVEISHMKAEDQKILAEIIGMEEIYPTMAQAKELKEMSQEGDCSEGKILSLLVLDSIPKTRIVLDQGLIMEYFRSDQSKEEITGIIEGLLHDWKYGKQR